MARSLLNIAVVQVGDETRQSPGGGFATPRTGMAGPTTPRVVMYGRQNV